MTENPFARTELLLGRQALERLGRARVAVFGVGGVGGYAVEALARSGVGGLDLVDGDQITLTNLNRQLHATYATLGRLKAEAARDRVLEIHPGAAVRAIPAFYTPQTADQFDLGQYDYLVDAVDMVTAKLLLAERAQAAGVPLISAMGAGNKLDPMAFRVGDIYETSVCPLARIMRKELRRRGVRQLKVVYSQEPPRTPTGSGGGEGCRPIPGSTAFVPAAAGLLLAAEVVRDLTGGNAICG